MSPVSMRCGALSKMASSVFTKLSSHWVRIALAILRAGHFIRDLSPRLMWGLIWTTSPDGRTLQGNLGGHKTRGFHVHSCSQLYHISSGLLIFWDQIYHEHEYIDYFQESYVELVFQTPPPTSYTQN